jgi:S-adenosylmethionine hydrolase
MIALFTDFGVAGPYLGQMRAALLAHAPDVPVIDLMSDVPACDVLSGAYLLPALTCRFPPGTVFLAVVDPGVGSRRLPVIVRADGHIFVGPGNGLFELVVRRAERAGCERIDWRPAELSSSFHGRDLFAPVAAMLARGDSVAASAISCGAIARPDWPDDLGQVVHIDNFGNGITGYRAERLPETCELSCSGHRIAPATTFSDVPKGQAFWYKNSIGLVEIAVNQGRAEQALGLLPGVQIEIIAEAR